MKKSVLRWTLCLVCIVSPLSVTGVAAQEDADIVAVADSVAAPQLRFGYLSYEATLRAMPEYAAVQEQQKALREAYNKEVSRVEKEFNKKYESFLEGQKDFPRSIMLKRQNELQQLMERNIEFKAKGRKELKDAEAEALKPLRERMQAVLSAIAAERHYAMILNTDANACLFIDPAMGQDIQDEVIGRLQTTE